ncbi:MAG: NHL repeat-containing protein [Spirochaetales bacterium]|nr:NHL repeat-containing protein [Spirochaetales bacterium]
MDRSKKKSQTPLLPLAMILITAASVSGCFNEKGNPYVNPYQYDIDNLARIDTSLLRYKETNRIPVPFDRPTGIAVDGNKVHVTGDRSLVTITSNGEVLRRISLDGRPTCIAQDVEGVIYIGITEHVSTYSADGSRTGVWASLGNKAVITSIAASPLYVFVADAGNRHICRYTKEGRLLGHIGGSTPSEPDGFLIPSPYFDVATAGDGREIWAANTGKHRIQRYKAEGKLISSWGVRSTAIEGFCGCCNPIHFTLLEDGSFVTAEKGLPRVKVYTPQGDFRCVVAGHEDFPIGSTGFDLASGDNGDIFVLDPAGKAVRIYSEIKREGGSE